MENSKFKLDRKEILKFLPHRDPFLMVDQILSIAGPNPMDDENPKNKLGIKVVGLKNILASEPHFAGHFPGLPIMPGVLIVESMAQISSFAMYPYMENKLADLHSTFQCVLVGVDQARFRVPVIPGDVLKIESEVTGCRTYLWTFLCKAHVGDKLVAEAKLMANLMPTSEKKIF